MHAHQGTHPWCTPGSRAEEGMLRGESCALAAVAVVAGMFIVRARRIAHVRRLAQQLRLSSRSHEAALYSLRPASFGEAVMSLTDTGLPTAKLVVIGEVHGAPPVVSFQCQDRLLAPNPHAWRCEATALHSASCSLCAAGRRGHPLFAAFSRRAPRRPGALLL